MADEQRIAEFIEVTNSNEETARLFLEACRGDVALAIETYLGNDDGQTAASDAPPPVAPPSRPAAAVAGLGDMASDEDDEGPQDNEYYAGGEKSGVAVKGGKKTDRIENLFDSVRQHGGVDGTEADLTAPRASRVFTGQARTLVGESSAYVPPPAEPAQPITIAFYTNGIFTIDDGPPRAMDDPANAEFLDCVRRGECPPELQNRSGGRPATVNFIRKGTEYQPPGRPRYEAFTGKGQTLSSGETRPERPATDMQPGGEWEGADETQPVTSIQIRFADGARVVARFNLHHTVMDIRRFIAALRPDLPTGLSVRTGFPSKPLEDDTLTVSQAGLINTVILYS